MSAKIQSAVDLQLQVNHYGYHPQGVQHLKTQPALTEERLGTQETVLRLGHGNMSALAEEQFKAATSVDVPSQPFDLQGWYYGWRTQNSVRTLTQSTLTFSRRQGRTRQATSGTAVYTTPGRNLCGGSGS